MKKDVNLICTEGSSNKYYNFHDNGDGTFTVTYGRIGSTKQQETYSPQEFTSSYSQLSKANQRNGKRIGFVTMEKYYIKTKQVENKPG